MKSKIFSVLIFSVALIVGCQKSTEPTPTTTKTDNVISSGRAVDLLLGYYNFVQQNTDVQMKVGSWVTMPTQNAQDRPFYADATFRNISNKISGASIGEASLVPDANNTYNNNLINNNSIQVKSVYGTTANFRFKDAENIMRTKALYIPKAINITSSDDQVSNIAIKVGTTITWNQDALNTKGVVFIIEYDPSLSPATYQTSPTPTAKSFAVTDNGSYTFKASDLEGLPLNANVRFSVGRAGFEVYQPENSTKTYSLYGYTIVDAMGIIK